ncbi:MAG: SPOR domain-containing protein [Alphaproteobacteria bacterium]
MNDDNNLDLLDLDEPENEALPDAVFAATPKPRKPWLLISVALVVIVLGVYIIIHMISSTPSSEIDINLDENTPEMIEVNPDAAQPDLVVEPKHDFNVVAQPEMPTVVKPDVKVAQQNIQVQQPQVQQPVQQQVVANETAGMPVRVVQDRKDVTFNPDKATVKTEPVKKTVKKTTTNTTKKSAVNGSWYVQFGSYATRDAAERAEKQIRKEHAGLLSGKQFVILAAVLKDGRTTYRLRIAFATSGDANGFCRNAKSDGLDCYVAR